MEAKAGDDEVKVLVGILRHPEVLALLVDIVHPEDFTQTRHRTLYETVSLLYFRGEPVTAHRVCAVLRQQGKLENVGGPEYVTALSLQGEEQGGVEHHARRLKRAATMRRLLDAGERIRELARTEEDEAVALEKAVQLLSRVNPYPTALASPLGEILSECKQELIRQRALRRELTGVPTGFASLDEITDGLQPSDMIVVAAPQSTGKTSFVLNIALHAALNAHLSIGIFSMEMNCKRLAQRLLAIAARAQLYRMRTGKLDDEEWERVSASAEQLAAQANIWIDDTADLSTEQLRQRARHLVEKEHVALIIVDYVHLLRATVDGRRLEHRTREAAEISRTLKVIARELNVPILVVSQMFTAVESRPLSKSRLADWRDGFLEHDADLVLMLYRDDLYDPESQYKNLVRIIIAKHRNGLTKDIDVYFQPEQNLFSDLVRAPVGYMEEDAASS